MCRGSFFSPVVLHAAALRVRVRLYITLTSSRWRICNFPTNTWHIACFELYSQRRRALLGFFHA